MKKFQKISHRIILIFLVAFIYLEWGIISDERAKFGIACGNPFVKEIALTFDDGPREKGMYELIDVLEKFNVKATFFLVGKFAERYSEITLKINSSGHEIANHTYTHPKLFKLWVEKIIREAERCDEVLNNLGIIRTRFLRPPGGKFGLEIFNAMRRYNLKLGLWNINTADYTGRPANEIINLVVKSARPGAIILMHSGVKNTVEALPEIIENLKSRGYNFVRISDLYNEGKI